MRRLLIIVLCLALLSLGVSLQAAQTVTMPNGQYLVVDPDYDAAGPVLNVGRVQVFNSGGSLATTIYGGTANDHVGSGGVVVIGDDRYVICSPQWDNGSIVDAGAITYGSLGMTFWGPVTSGGSTWAGSTANDQVGSGGITKVGTDFCLIRSPQWDNGTAVNAGAVTFISDGVNYSTGAISAGNSLVGGTTEDQVGSGGVTVVGTQYFIIHSPLWDNGAAADAGALSRGWAGYDMFVGLVSATNSMVGSATGDQIGSGGITKVGTNNVIVRSPLWDNGAATNAGAVTLRFVDYFYVGVISATNSLVGASANDQIGSGGLTVVGTDYFIIRSPMWDNGVATNAGAVTPQSIPYFRGATVAASNSIVGSSTNDQVGSGGITLVGSELFVVRSPLWDNGAVTNAGAVTPQSLPYFRAATVAASNSIVGSSANDQVGSGGVTAVGSDIFLVRSPLWDNGGVTDAGAVTPSSMSYFQAKTVSTTNSLVGGSPNDQVGSGGITTIGTTAYLIRSPLWDHSGVADAGAVTYGTTSYATFGVISRLNSLVGSHPNDQISSGDITTSGGTSFTISSPNWCHGAGATTSGTTSVWIWGVVDIDNSTVGAESSMPEIALLQPAQMEVASNGSRDFGAVAVGSTQGLSFVIQNTGTDDLWLNGVTRVAISGTDAAHFKVAAQPDSFIIMGGSVGFTVNFTPTSAGTKTAQISISNSDSNESPYRVSLTGTALSRVASWRQTHFGSSANTGPGADDADFDKDGVPNLVEYALGLHPAQNSAGQLPLPATNSGNFVLGFTEPASISGITYGAEWSASLVGGSWQSVTDTGTSPQHIFSVPINGNTKLFMRLKVTASP